MGRRTAAVPADPGDLRPGDAGPSDVAVDGLEVTALPTVPRTSAGLVDLDALAHALRPCDLLESALGSGPGGWSYVLPHRGLRLVADDAGLTLLVDGARPQRLDGPPLPILDALCHAAGITPHAPRSAALPPCTGGLVGALAYDLGRTVEHLPDPPPQDRAPITLHLRLVDTVVAVPPDRTTALLLRRETLGPALLAASGGDTPTRARLAPPPDAAWITARLRDARPPTAPPPPTAHDVTTSLDRPAYLAALRTVQDAIAAGDAYQVNVTQRLTARWEGDVWDLYHALRRESAAAYGAVLPDVGIASISPETFLEVDGRTATTRPIKGTRPRSGDPTLDAALADDLATSTKDRAENVMVVDLERNDLGRVCVPGTVQVPRLLDVEAHPTVWHLVSTVRGQLRDDVGYGALLQAVFPCGSITGAPKVAAMRLIDRVEQVRRGWYCGAIGFLSPGAAHLSVAIRTATLGPDGAVDFGAGGGIVADSDADDEHAESLDKAAAFLRAVGATAVRDGGAR